MQVKKSQVLIITTFAIISTAFIVFILLLPILSSLRAIKELEGSYQSYASAEAGLELELLNQRYATDTDILQPPSGGPGALDIINCESSHRRGDQKVGHSKNCTKGEIKFDLNITTTTYGELKIEAEGKKDKIFRSLFLITIITVTTTPITPQHHP